MYNFSFYVLNVSVESNLRLACLVNGAGSTCCIHVNLNTWKLKQETPVVLMSRLLRVDTCFHNNYFPIVHKPGKRSGIVGVLIQVYNCIGNPDECGQPVKNDATQHIFLPGLLPLFKVMQWNVF